MEALLTLQPSVQEAYAYSYSCPLEALVEKQARLLEEGQAREMELLETILKQQRATLEAMGSQPAAAPKPGSRIQELMKNFEPPKK